MTKTGVTPFIKWAGGKQIIAESLVAKFPDHYDRYFEPFLGGGSILFELQPPCAVVGDANLWLIQTYEEIRDNPVGVMHHLDGLVNTKAAYLKMRSVPPQSLPKIERAAQFIFLNKTCFRGLFRVNRKGQFNVPYGQYQRRYYDADNILAASRLLQNVAIRTGDFELVIHDAGQNDFVYFDPPYYQMGGYSDFNRYTSGQFREPDHMRLAALCYELNDRGIRWAVSNSDTDFVRSLFSKFTITRLENRREINLQSASRTVTELLITNYTPPSLGFQQGLFTPVAASQS